MDWRGASRAFIKLKSRKEKAGGHDQSRLYLFHHFKRGLRMFRRRLALVFSAVVWAASAGAQEIPPCGATSSTSDTNLPGNAIDNNLATRWSGSGDGAWLQIDLCATQ